MKKLLLLCTAVLFSLGMDALAQTAVPAQNSGDGSDVQTEIRTLSGQLKETYSSVYQQLNLLSKEIAATGTEPQTAQATFRDEMTLALSQLEGMLSTVNSADEAQWADIKSKAALVIERATALVEKRKAAK